MMEVLAVLSRIFDLLCSIGLLIAFGYYFLKAHSSWRKGFEIEAIWRILNAIFWAVIYYGYYVWL